MRFNRQADTVVVATGLLGVMLVVILAACGALKPIVHAVWDLQLSQCLAERPDLPKEELQKVCPWVEALDPAVDAFLASQRKGSAKLAGAAVCKDAGPP